MTVELGVATLACARIGAVHSVVFAGFSAQALRDRIQDASAKVVITANESVRGNKVIPLKPVVDEALECPSVTDVVVQKVTNPQSAMEAGRTSGWMRFWPPPKRPLAPPNPWTPRTPCSFCTPRVPQASPRGGPQPRGLHGLHRCQLHQRVSIRRQRRVLVHRGYWLDHGALVHPVRSAPQWGDFTHVRGGADLPHPWAFLEVCEKHNVNQFYTAPTAIRALMAHGNEHVERHDLSSLKVLWEVLESPSTRKRGLGTTRLLVKSAVPSSTRGGKLKQEASC